MGEADAHKVGGQLNIVHVRGGIDERVPIEERRRQESEGIVCEHRGLRRRMQVDVGRKVTMAQLIPEPVRAVRIVIAGQQMPVHGGEIPHPFERLVERPRTQCDSVINVPG
ncbi:MAG: hypothetical protein ACRET2_05935, partial [Steroidobacteraceae bacterium]